MKEMRPKLLILWPHGGRQKCMHGMWPQNKYTHFNITISRGQTEMDTDQSILRDQRISLLPAIRIVVF